MIYFKELAHMIVRSSKAKTHRTALEAEDRQEFIQRDWWVSGCLSVLCDGCCVCIFL